MAAVAVWSILVLTLLFFDPGYRSPLAPCMALAGHSATCDAAQERAQQAFWEFHTLPMQLTIAAGYLAIIGVRLGRVRVRGERGMSHA